MFHQKIKQCFSHSVHLVSSIISEFTYSDAYLTRNRKFPADKLITFLVSQGSSSTRNELLDFFGMDPQSPTASALNQQRAKLSPDVPEEYHVSEGHSIKGFYSMHLNAFYDLQKHTYSDALIQLIHQKDEFRAFCEMVDRHVLLTDAKDVFIGGRGYCSYNNMAHVSFPSIYPFGTSDHYFKETFFLLQEVN